MTMLGLTPIIQNKLIERLQMDGSVALGAGALAGSFFSATITHPMDTIKTCMQGDVEQTKYTNIRETGRSLANEFGVAQGLFKGLGWRISLIATAFFLLTNLNKHLPR